MLNSSKKLLDANVLLRVLLQDDKQLFRAAERVIQTAEEESLIVPAMIAAEVLYILDAHDYSRSQRAHALLFLIGRPVFARDVVLGRALDLYADTTLDFPDCYLVMRALVTGESLQTFDKPLQKIYAALGGRRLDAASFRT